MVRLPEGSPEGQGEKNPFEGQGIASILAYAFRAGGQEAVEGVIAGAGLLTEEWVKEAERLAGLGFTELAKVVLEASEKAPCLAETCPFPVDFRIDGQPYPANRRGWHQTQYNHHRFSRKSYRYLADNAEDGLLEFMTKMRGPSAREYIQAQADGKITRRRVG